jgi:hypothetical protein
MATALCLFGLSCAREERASSGEPSSDGSLCGPAYPEFAPGMTVDAGALRVRLLSATPTPPRQKVPNHWAIEVTSEAGAKLSDVTLSNPDSFMPVHNHHGRSKPAIAPDALRIEDIDFNMRGPWQVLVDLNQGGSKVGTATFQVCVR